MSRSRTVVLELSEERARWIDDRVVNRGFADAQDVINDALDTLALDEQLPPLFSDEEIRAAVAPVLERVDSGTAEWRTPEQVFDGLLDRHAARQARKAE